MEYSIKPEEHELREARQVVERILESCSYIVEKKEEIRINLGFTDSKEYGALGNALSSERVQMNFNSLVDGWKEDLEDVVADVYGQAYFHENSEVNFQWQQVLASVIGLMIIEELSEPREVEKEDFREEWAEKKTEISEEASIESRDALSWQLETLLGRKLLEDYELEDFPDLKRSDVLEAGDALFS
jgi:hypothetical protein